MELSLQRQRMNAWKKNFKEKIGRDQLSSIKGFVVAGSIFDVLDDLWIQTETIRLNSKDNGAKNKHDVFLYRMILYPPTTLQKKRFNE